MWPMDDITVELPESIGLSELNRCADAIGMVVELIPVREESGEPAG